MSRHYVDRYKRHYINLSGQLTFEYYDSTEPSTIRQLIFNKTKDNIDKLINFKNEIYNYGKSIKITHNFYDIVVSVGFNNVIFGGIIHNNMKYGVAMNCENYKRFVDKLIKMNYND